MVLHSLLWVLLSMQRLPLSLVWKRYLRISLQGFTNGSVVKSSITHMSDLKAVINFIPCQLFQNLYGTTVLFSTLCFRVYMPHVKAAAEISSMPTTSKLMSKNLTMVLFSYLQLHTCLMFNPLFQNLL